VLRLALLLREGRRLAGLNLKRLWNPNLSLVLDAQVYD